MKVRIFYRAPFYRIQYIPLKKGGICKGVGFNTIEKCVEECKKMCRSLDVNYDDCEAKLFLTDSDGVWECTEEGEFAG